MSKERSVLIEYLDTSFQNNESDIVVLYGTEGVKINETFKTFVKNKSFLYFCAHEGSERELKYYLKAQLVNKGVSFDSECPSFREILEKISQVTIKEKTVLIFDRIDLCARCSSDFFDELFSFVRETKTDNRYLVLLVSSKVSFVENSLIEKLGRNAYFISSFLKVRPLQFLDLVCNYDTDETLKCMESYALFGGMDKYWNCFDIHKSIKDNVLDCFLKDNAPFRNIGIDAILSELREPLVYATILGTIAEGNNKLNDMHKKTDFTRAKISVYLKNLMEIELVEKVYSFDTGGAENTKKGVYRISNPLVNFWFTYIYPNEYKLGIISPEEFYDEFIAPGINAYIGASFALVCTEYINLLNDRDLLPIKLIKQGEWVGKAGTIHMIAQDEMREFLTGFVCMDKEIMTYEDYEWYIFCLKEAHVHPAYEYFFSVNGFDDRMKALASNNRNINLIEMKDF